MYASFILAGFVFLMTVIGTFLALYAAGMSDAPNVSSGAGPIFATGTIIAVLIAATHWLPAIRW